MNQNFLYFYSKCDVLSLFLALFSLRLRFQRENGLIAREWVKWYPKKPICENRANKLTSVGFVEIKAALFVLVMGTAGSFAILLIEIALHKMLKDRFRRINI